MNLSLGQSLVLAYLFFVLILGGASAAGFSGNTVLQLVGAALIAWTFWSDRRGPSLQTGLRTFLIALAIVAALQFLPLPPAVWHLIPGRAPIAEGFDLAGMAHPWLTLSLNPWATLQSLVWWIPAFALFLAMRSSHAPATRHLVWVIAAVAYASVVLAGVQSLQNSGYFYAITNRGNGVGLFANSNHLGTFMLIAIALVAAQWIYDTGVRQPSKVPLPRHLQLLGLLAPLVIGVFLSNSLACMLLLIPLLTGVYLLSRPQLKLNWWVALAAGLGFTAGLMWLLASGLVANDLMSQSGTAGISRGEFLANGMRMIGDFAPLGSGIGTFRELYPWYEEPARVTTTYVNHAHNDLLELLIETGIFGVILIVLFGRWLIATVWNLWSKARNETTLAQGATLAAAAILTHSLVDYPLRTAAISSLMFVCCIIARRNPEPRGAAAVTMAEPGAGKRETMMQI